MICEWDGEKKNKEKVECSVSFKLRVRFIIQKSMNIVKINKDKRLDMIAYTFV
jgi:hypothetical protein